MILIDDKTVRLVAKQAITLIKKRTEQGNDIDDKPFKPYSDKNFVMPAAAIKKGQRTAMNKAGLLEYFNVGKGDSAVQWVVVIGGYVVYKKYYMAKAQGYSANTVNLTLTGSMLRSMNIKQISGNNISIGFNRSEEANKAVWNISKGRNFFSLSPNDVKKINFDGIAFKNFDVNIK